MSELAVASSCWRHRRPSPVESPADDLTSLEDCIRAAQVAGECPSGWPVYAPDDYEAQLEVKAGLVRRCFPEASTVEVMPSPPSHHRMRAKMGIDEFHDPICYSSYGQGALPDTLPIAAKAINECMPLLLVALRADPVLRRGVTSVAFLATTQGHEVVACLIYRLPLDETEWTAAAKRAVVGMSQSSSLEVSLLGQAKNQRIDVGKAYVTECYALQDGRHLHYKHVLGHFSNPNAYACAQTLNFLSEVVRDNVLDRKSTDLLELYCGNGNHTVALAPLFRGALAVEINPTLVAAAAENLAANDVTNCAVQVSPSAKFCSRILQHQQWTHAPSGQTFEFGAVLVDPPRSGLDAPTLELVCRYKHVLYISCNPFVSLRRDLDGFLAAGLSLRRLALIDHFPYTPHTECAVYLSRS